MPDHVFRFPSMDPESPDYVPNYDPYSFIVEFEEGTTMADTLTAAELDEIKAQIGLQRSTGQFDAHTEGMALLLATVEAYREIVAALAEVQVNQHTDGDFHLYGEYTETDVASLIVRARALLGQ